ncbi:MAG TPA: DUF1343 domain-containing protein [Sphaerochaeta sp.]|nr:DUF1343 domain-containing protein [Sphaerochaeta sp.]
MRLCGLENIASQPHLFQKRRLGLVTTASAVDSSLYSSVEVLSSLYDLKALFAPEHGLFSDIADGEPVATCTDANSGLPVYSLYQHEGQSLSSDMVEGIDALVFDIQDLGLRFYTYIATLKNLLIDASSLGLPVIVLDRPNPLGGVVVEGNILGKDSFSFVGPASLPIRYALSIGELALYLNTVEEIGCDLSVVPLTGWRRSMYFSDLGLPWVMTSPAIAHFSTALLYAGMCLFEGTNLSEGRGTSAPFSLIGSPFLEPFSLSRMANGLGLAEVGFTPAHFTPTASKYAHESCKGLYVHVLDKHQFRPVKTALSLINLIAKQYPGEFSFLPAGKEGSMMSIERLAGRNTQAMLLQDLPHLLHAWEDESRLFTEQKQRFHLYQ